MGAKKGSLRQLGAVRQPGGTVTVKSDGSAEGVLVYKCDHADILRTIPGIWSRHPNEPSLFCHNINVEYQENNIAQATLSYFGLTASYDENSGKDSIEIIGECTQAPIQTHKNFEDIAGTPENPKNNALWLDATTGEPAKKAENAEFKGWTSGEFAGTEFYLVPGTIVRRTYFSRSSPATPQVGKIVKRIKGFKGDAGGNYMFLGYTAREMGGVFQITEEYKAGNWNKKIYDT